MAASLGFSHLAVLAIVAGAQIFLLRRALAAAAGIAPSEREEIRQRCEADLSERAGRGLPPDWHYCQNELERAYEIRDDRIRRLASAALAVGLLGTLLAIVLHFFTSGGGFEPARLIAATGVALLGSLLGVIGHLAIVLVILPRAEEIFRSEATDFDGFLRRRNEAQGGDERPGRNAAE